MKELLEYREKLIKRLREAAQEFRQACESADRLKRPAGEWTAHQLASHTRDVEKLVYGERIRRTIQEENPEFKNFDADSWMAEHYSSQEPLESILTDFTSNVGTLCDMLEKLPREAWSRVGRHEIMGGGLTMQIWVERSLAHIEEHLRTVKTVENQ